MLRHGGWQCLQSEENNKRRKDGLAIYDCGSEKAKAKRAVLEQMFKESIDKAHNIEEEEADDPAQKSVRLPPKPASSRSPFRAAAPTSGSTSSKSKKELQQQLDEDKKQLEEDKKALLKKKE